MTTNSRVLCINDSFPTPLRKVMCEFPVKGRTYTIRAILPGRQYLHPLQATSKVIPCLLLKELLNPPDPRNKHGWEMGFSADRFREVEPGQQEHEVVSFSELKKQLHE